MKERAKGKKVTFALVAVLMLAVLLGGFSGGVLYEKAKTEPVITLYRTQVDAWQRQHDQVLIMAEGYQVAFVEATGQLDEVSEMLEVTQQEKTDLLSQLENLERGGYIPFSSKAEIREYVKLTGISQRKYVHTTYDCDDFAIDLVVRAYEDKRMIGLWGYPGHLKCFAIEGNNIYGVDPQGNVVSVVNVLD